MIEKFFRLELPIAGKYIAVLSLARSLILIFQAALALTKSDWSTNAPVDNGIIVTAIVIYSLDVIAACLLLQSLKKSNHQLMIPWLVMTIFVLTLALIQAPFLIMSIAEVGFQARFGAPLILLIISFCITTYAWMAIYSLYKIYRDNYYNEISAMDRR